MPSASGAVGSLRSLAQDFEIATVDRAVAIIVARHHDAEGDVVEMHGARLAVRLDELQHESRLGAAGGARAHEVLP